jgi:predicted permease
LFLRLKSALPIPHYIFLPFAIMLDTFVASMKSVGTAVSMASVGIYLHQRGFINASDKRTLAVISQQVTFPLFLFTTILNCKQDWSNDKCPDVTETLKTAWILAIWPIFVVGTGLFVGHIISRFTDTPKSQRKSAIAAVAFGNSTGLPITLLTVIHSNFPITSRLGLVDPALFLSVYLLLYPVLQWGMGGWLLAQEYQPKTETVDNEDVEEEQGSTEAFIRGQSYYITKNILNKPIAEEYFHSRSLSSSDEGLYLSQGNLAGIWSTTSTKNPSGKDFSPVEVINDSVGLELSEDHPLLIDQSPRHTSPSPLPTKIKDCNGMSHGQVVATTDKTHSTGECSNQQNELIHTLKNIAERSLQPPVIGALLGIIFSLIHPLRGSLVDVLDRDGDAPLEFLFDGLYAVGKAAVPLNMIILGCNLSNSYNQYTGNTEKSATPDFFSTRTMMGIVLGKMLVLPVIGILSTLLLRIFVLKLPEEIAPSFYLVAMIVFLTVR